MHLYGEDHALYFCGSKARQVGVLQFQHTGMQDSGSCAAKAARLSLFCEHYIGFMYIISRLERQEMNAP